MTSFLKYSICGLLFTCIALSACMNEYETQIIGYYEVDKFEPLDSNVKDDLPALVLNRDKTFAITFKDKQITGKWEAHFAGDFTVANFTFDNQSLVQGELYGQHYEKMEIVNPLDFHINAKSFSFKRVEKH